MNKQAFARVGAGMALMLVAASMLAPVASAQSLDAATATATAPDAALAGAHRSERKAEEREKYLAIGESARLTLKFRRPAPK